MGCPPLLSDSGGRVGPLGGSADGAAWMNAMGRIVNQAMAGAAREAEECALPTAGRARTPWEGGAPGMTVRQVDGGGRLTP